MTNARRTTAWERVRQWARRLKRDGLTLWFAIKDPRTPWYAKALAVAVVAYALSPIDLIPDFIPVLGYLDDVILLPALVWLTLRLLPAPVLEECRAQAELWIAQGHARPRSMAGAIAIALFWMAVLAGAALYFRQGTHDRQQGLAGNHALPATVPHPGHVRTHSSKTSLRLFAVSIRSSGF